MRTTALYAPGLLAVPLAAAGRHEVFQARQAGAATAPAVVEDGIQTECKTCPYKLCTNTAAYLYGQDMTLTCWTRGDTIVDTDVWFKTTDGCFVTEWDVVEGNYTDVLGSCGEVPETYTQGPSRTVFHTECNIIPEFVGEPEDHTKMYKPEVDLTLTCSTSEGASVLGNTVWYRTLSNCYVPEAQIEFVDAGLDDCGPIPFMEEKMREPDEDGTEAAATAATAASPGRRDGDREARAAERRWLYLTQIGEDSADCLSEASSAGTPERSYGFGEYVVVQCATFGDNPADNDQIFLLTEEFCWVNDTLTDPQLLDSVTRAERYPNCKLFVDTEV